MFCVITHRGIDADKHHSYSESSAESFYFFLQNGFGLEFDVQITKDGVPVISHDASLERISGQSCPLISTMSVVEFLATPLPNGHTITLKSLLAMIAEFTSGPERIHALHLKHNNQTQESIDCILRVISDYPNTPLLLFDVKPKWAKYIRSINPELKIGGSVAHSFDRQRYNEVVGDTLLTMDEIIQNKNLYDWAWLDEWDTIDAAGGNKKLYTSEVIAHLHKEGFKVAVVSPELHATSPKLLGGENHSDAKNKDALEKRWHELASTGIEAICTDYPFSHNKLFL